MNVTLTSLEALILKATHESLPCPDAPALEAFCAVMRDSPEGPQYAAQALAARIHSSNAREALLALSMLDRCMRRCDSNFHGEVGKFRFLNEMIKLVSPKYFAERTAPEVRMRVLQLLHAWSIEYPKETKFKVAYDMLKNQGVVKETPPPLPPEDSQPAPRARVKSAIFEDEEKSKLLQKLLQSKKPEDLQHANRLIKTMVREEERRGEVSMRRWAEVGAARESAALLRALLAAAAEPGLLRDLRHAAQALRPALTDLAAAAHPDQLGEILDASDALDEVFEMYDAYMRDLKEDEEAPVATAESNGDSLVDLAGNAPAASSVIDELGDIFSTEGATANIAEPLKPVSLMPSEEIDLLGNKKDKAEGWNELDSLSKQLLRQSLPDNAKHIGSFTGKPTKKIPMNALEKVSPKHEALPENGAVFDLDFLLKKPEPTPAPTGDDVMVDITDAASNNNTEILDIGLSSAKSEPVKCASEVKPVEAASLTGISVSVEELRPCGPPVTAFSEEGGLRVVLHVCGERPRPGVRVLVVSTHSDHATPVDDYKFQVVVPKGCRSLLLPASGSSLPAARPFFASAPITQVLLLSRPAGVRVSLKFAITYALGDDLRSHLGSLTDLPLDDD